jgi:hypothetical protein
MAKNSSKAGDPHVSAPPVAKVKKKTGPKPLVLQDLSGILDKVEAMSPPDRQAHRTRLAEGLVDAWILRATERLLSDKVRSQDLVAVSGFLRSNQFIVSPSKEGIPDALEILMQKKRADEAEDALRLKRMAKAKEVEEKRIEKFYSRVNGEPLSPRLNAGDPGRITDDNEEGDLSND